MVLSCAITDSVLAQTVSNIRLKRLFTAKIRLCPAFTPYVFAVSPNGFFCDGVIVVPRFQWVVSLLLWTTLSGTLTCRPATPAPKPRVESPVGNSSDNRGATAYLASLSPRAWYR